MFTAEVLRSMFFNQFLYTLEIAFSRVWLSLHPFTPFHRVHNHTLSVPGSGSG